jgi:hypothetical protein
MLAAFPPPPVPDENTVNMFNIDIPRSDGTQLRLLVLRPAEAEGKRLPVVSAN